MSRRCTRRASADATFLTDASRGPHQDVEPAGEEELGSDVRHADPARFGQRVALDARRGALQGPGPVVDVGGEELARARGGVEAVALGEEVLERAGPRALDGSRGGVARPELGRRSDRRRAYRDVR